MTISIVQSKSGTGTSLSFTSPTTAGNCVVVCVLDTNTSAPSVTAVKLGGSAGNFAVAATAAGTGTFHAYATVWANPGCAGGQTAIAITESNSGAPVIIAYEIAGLATASVVDVTHTGTGTAASWSSGATATTAQANEAWIGAACITNTAPTGPASPWTNISQASTPTDGIAGTQIVSSTGTATYSGTGGGSSGWAAVVVTLKASGVTSVPLSPATVSISANQLGVSAGPVALAPATVTVTANPITPVIVHSVALAPATITVAVQRLAIPRTVTLHTAAVAIAAHALTPVVTTPQLIASIAPVAGTDEYGNPYQAGFTVYDPSNSTWCQMDSGAVNFSNGAVISNAVSGLLNINNNGVAGIEVNSNTDEIDLNASQVNADGNSITGLFNNLDPSGLPLSGSATLAAVISAVNSMFQRFQNMGIFQ